MRLIAPAVLLAFALMKAGLMFHMDALALNKELIFVEDYNNFNPTIGHLLKQLFISPYLWGSQYVGPLWTIRVEFFGTLLCYPIAYYLHNKAKGAELINYLVLTIIFMFLRADICAFLLGMAVFDLYYYQEDETNPLSYITRFVKKHALIRIPILIFGIYFACCNMDMVGMYAWLKFFPAPEALRAGGIAMVMYIVLLSPNIQKFFAGKALLWLGKVSPYTYIFHWPIILSLGCGLYVMLHGKMEYTQIAAIISVVCIAATMIVSVLYPRAVAWVSPKLKQLCHKVLKREKV